MEGGKAVLANERCGKVDLRDQEVERLTKDVVPRDRVTSELMI